MKKKPTVVLVDYLYASLNAVTYRRRCIPLHFKRLQRL